MPLILYHNLAATDSRADPFYGTTATTLVETLRIPDYPPFVVQLQERPSYTTPSVITVLGFQEVQYLPNSGEFRVDYKYPTGGLLFSAQDRGRLVAITYLGIGGAFSARHVNAIQSYDPQDRVEQFNRYSSVEDHFCRPDINPTIWRTATQSIANILPHAVRLASTVATPHEMLSYNGGYPGSGFILHTRIFLDDALKQTAANTPYYAIGSYSAGTIHTVLRILATTNTIWWQLYYKNTSATMIAQDITVYPLQSDTFSVWYTITLIYTPGAAGGYLYEQIDTDASQIDKKKIMLASLVGTFSVGNLYVYAHQVSGTGVNTLALDVDNVMLSFPSLKVAP